ncbi:MAG: tripartite tricarboxylate transporter substrate binding protein, partial [Rhodoferax sp.]|nr:tripartite tricarboxylate transporter substrate binding protein [Rhodoferax sp.]
PVIDKLDAAMTAAFADPEVRARLEANGFVVVVSKPADFSKFVQDEVTRWSKVVQAAGLKLD